MDQPAPMRPKATPTETWVFDLDNTLYPPSARLFDQIDRLMTGFIADRLSVSRDDADQIRRDTWARYGATLTGLIAEHDVEAEDFLHATHQLDLSGLAPDARLGRAIEALPGRRIIHTNGPRAHADRVLAARGLTDHFDVIVALEDTNLIAKPHAESTAAMVALTGIDPARAVMIEDQPKNLLEPWRIGMTTVWVADHAEDGDDHIDHAIQDLTPFLEQIARG